MSGQWIVWIAAIGAAFAFTGCHKADQNSNQQDQQETKHSNMVNLSAVSINQIGLQTQSVHSASFTGHLAIPAKVISNQDHEAQVGSLVPGRVATVCVKVGDTVKPGQELMQVEGLEIGEIKAGFLTAKANLDFQKVNFERQKLLIQENIGSQKSFLEAQAEYEKARAEFNAQDKKIHSIGLSDDDVLHDTLDHSDDHTPGTLPVRSPIGGVVVERNVVIGQLVDGATNAFRILNTSSVWIDGQIYEKDLSRIAENSKATFISPTYPNELFNGKVFYIGQTIDEKSRTITVRADFANPTGKLKPQMFGELEIPSTTSSRAILIPAEALVKIDNADYVFLQQNDSTFEKRAVVVGFIHNEQAEIKQGLLENDKVVVKGGFYLKSELMKEDLEGE